MVRRSLTLSIAVVSACFALTAPALAWNATGHMLVAYLALGRLSPHAKAEVERLSAIGATDKTDTFITGSVWADDTRTKENGPWHYVDLYFRADGKEATLQPPAENVVWAINHFSAILKDRSRSDGERSDALRYITHFVGDIHQPLHCTARITSELPDGDRGGNLFYIESASESPGRRPHNLHYFWDEGGGLFRSIGRPMAESGMSRLARLASQVPGVISQAQMQNALGKQDPAQWAKESRTLAIYSVYDTPEGQAPNADYTTAVRKLSLTRVAVAGARLAVLLNRLLK